ncbi:MAG: methyltransferase domain-containing protein [Actinomycetes bacterium]
MMFADDIRQAVGTAYAKMPTGGGEPITSRAYSAEELADMPPGAVAWALGVGNPVRHADLEPGATVLDVGSGGGIDTILAANRVGPGGHVIGLDLLEEMCARGRMHASEAGVASWTEFRSGQMEAIPLEEGLIDVVISNGVINLSARKSRTLAEIIRVLRPGGRLCVADLLVDEELPPRVLGSPSAWAGCISGALSERVLLRKLRNVGFDEIWIGHRVPFGLAEAALYPLFTSENIGQLRRLLPVERHDRVATAALVKARKPS